MAGSRTRRQRSRVLVPFDLAFFRAPYRVIPPGQRLSDRRTIRIGFWPSTLHALALYGPLIAGGIVWWRIGHQWVGLARGIGALLAAEIIAIPIALAARAATSRRRPGGATTPTEHG